jgi:hypothetical protein
MASHKLKPQRTIDLEALRSHRSSMKSKRVVVAENTEKVKLPTTKWKFDEAGLYVGTPHRFIRNNFGDAVVIVVGVISKHEVEIIVDGITMIVHPRELRPLDYNEGES